MEEWKVFICVIVHPLAHVVGNVEGAVVVATELVVDEHEFVVVILEAFFVVLVSDENVATLNVVMTEHDGRVDAGKKFSAIKTKLKSYGKCLNFNFRVTLT